MKPLLLLALTACGPSASEGPAIEPGVHTWLQSTTGQGGVFVAQITAPASAEVQLGQPVSTGLEFSTTQPVRVELAGDVQVLTQTWSFTGESGHYEVRGPAAGWPGAEQLPSPLFVDLGKAPPRSGELIDITDPDLTRPIPWGPVLAGTAAAFLVLGGVLLAFRRPRAEPEPEPLAAHERALREWASAWADATLDDHDKALAISRIFRDYTEAALSFPAAAWTTTEILSHMAGMAHLEPSNVPRAKRLLRATDRVKFAEVGTTAEMFEQLDGDLRAFVGSTRPRGLNTGGPE